MLKRISKWKRVLAIVMTVIMLFTNNYGVIEAFAEDQQPSTNFEIKARLVVNNGDTVVEAGEKFQYVLEYNAAAYGDSKYTAGLLSFTLPDYVELVKDENGNYDIIGRDYSHIIYTPLTNEYLLYFNSPLPMHETNTLTIGMTTKNLVTPNDIVLDFDEGFNFQIQIESNGKPEKVERVITAGKIKTEAKSDWQITKENTTSIDNGNYNYEKIGSGENAKFEVTYRVRVNDERYGVDRLGRLGFESYKVVDTLPTNLPVGGEALEIKDVHMVRSTGDVALTDKEFKIVEENGHPVGIEFYTYDVIKDGDTFKDNETSDYIKAGDPTSTTYEYTVVYPYNPYTTSADNISITEHTLTNTATLHYKLVGENNATDTDTANVNIGAYEENTIKTNVSVTKYAQFKNGEKELLDTAAQQKYNFTGNNAVKFTMYTDAACTNIAYNTSLVLMRDIAINADGVAYFPEIREGTYYIKEVSGNAGWQAPAVIQVVIGKDAQANATVNFDAVNTADTINAVEFTKTGTDAYGQTDNTLAGATFTLTNKTDSSKTYTAKSDANGRVRFDNIPDGTYILKETAVDNTLKDKGYEVSNITKEFEVRGGVVVYPDLGNNNVFQNLSNKGLLSIIKEDAKNPNTKLSNAVFEVYGPYNSQDAADAAKADPKAPKVATLSTGSNGSCVSDPLQKGWYVVVETQAPTNYTAGEPVVVKVTERQQLTKTIKNDPQAHVSFTKKGAENNTSHFVQELAGATFEIYTDAGERLYGVQDRDGNYTDVSTDSANRTPVTIVTKLDPTKVSVSNSVSLSPGTYKYKETAVPAPFKPDNEFVNFEVRQVSPSGGSTVWNTSQTITVNNYLEYGQIRIVKGTDNNSTDPSALNGAQFGVYATKADAQNDTNRVDLITTGTHTEGNDSVHGVGYSDAQLELGKTYYIKELVAPSGYALNTTIEEVTPTAAEKQVEWNCVNKATVSIKITKVDSEKPSLGLKGAKFGLYTAPNNTGLIKELTTDDNGVVTFGNLNPNTTYYYKEISAPSNYVIIDGGFNAITTGSTGENAVATATETNARLGTFQLHKTKADGSNLGSVGFRLAPVTPGAQNTAAGLLADTENLTAGRTTSTNSSGNASFANLVPGTYWLIETVPSGFETDQANDYEVGNGWKVVKYSNQEYFFKQVTVAAGENAGTGYKNHTEEIVNNPTKGKIQITKYAAKADGTAGTSTINGAVFTLYKDAGCTQSVATLTTASGGTKTSGYLVPGTYYLQETSVPSPYVISDKVYEVKVVAGKTVTTDVHGNDLLKIANGKTGSFTVSKVAAYKVDGSSTNEVVRETLLGAVFALYKHEASFTATGLPADIADSKIVKTIDLSESTSGSSGPLEPGVYWLRETVTPDGYETAPDSLVRVNPDGSIRFATWVAGTAVENLNWTTKPNSTITVDNESLKPRIRLIKHEYNNPNNLLDDALFEVYVADPNGTPTNVDGTIVNLKRVYNDGTFEQSGDNGVLGMASGTATNSSDVIQHGQALTPWLEAGHTYYFKETQAPDGYYFDPDDAWQSVTIPAGATGEFRVIFVNYPIITVPGIKVNEKGDASLSGAVLAVFENKADSDAMLERLATDYNELTNPLDEATVRDNAENWNIHEIVKSTSTGAFTFNNMMHGKTYYIVEVVAPVDYQLDKDSSGNYVYYKVVVSSPYNASAPFAEVYKGDVLQTDAQGQPVHVLSIVNYAKQQIWLHKKAKVSGAEYWVTDATFTIYPSKTVDGELVPDTSVELTPNSMGEGDDGRFLSHKLPAGTYWLCETNIPEGFEEAERDAIDGKLDYITIDNVRYYKVELGRTVDNTWFKDHPVYNEAKNGRFVIKKIDSTNDKNVQVRFELDRVDGEFDAITIDTPSAGYYLSGYLPAGLYTLKETTVLSGNYTRLEDPIYIRIGAGQITDNKVYANETIDGKSVKVYQPNPDIDATADAAGELTLNDPIVIENAPKGKFYIRKTGKWMDETQNLANVSFSIYKKNSESFATDKLAGNVGTIKTTTDKYKASPYLDAGEYWVVETGITGTNADEFKKDSYTPFTVTVTAGQVSRVTANTYTVENISNYGKFKVTKVDSADASVKISGVTFSIYDNAACSGTAVGSMTDNKDGTYTSPRLQPGKDYYLKEIKTADGYSLNKDKTFGPYTVTANNLTVVSKNIENEHDKSLTVVKYEQQGNTQTQTKIDGATFGLYATRAEAEAATAAAPGSAIKGVQTTTNGQVKWSALSNGTYYLKELSAPSKYLVDDTVHEITIADKNGNTFAYSRNVYNLLKGGFVLDKVVAWLDGQTETGIVGKNISFNLYKDSVAESNFITKLTTNDSGRISYTNCLPAGQYVLVELDTTVEGFEHAFNKPTGGTDADNDGNYIDESGNIHINVLASKNNEVFTGTNAVRNTANFGRFKLFKKTYTNNEQTQSTGLNGATYLLEKYDDVNATWSYMGEIAVNANEWNNGEYVSGAIAPGKYRVTEKTAPISIQNANNVSVDFTVDPDPIVFDVTAAAYVEVSHYDGIYRDLKVIKTADSRNGQAALKNVTFELYHANADATVGKYTYDGDPTTLAQYIDSENSDIIGSAKTTGADGVVVFSKLEPGKYVLVETSVPDGYEKQVAVLVINESLSYVDVVQEYEIVNSSNMGRIRIRKEDASDEPTTDNPGNAQFAVYAEDDTNFQNPLATVSVAMNGSALTSLLPAERYYWVKETKAPDGYSLDDRLQPTVKKVYVSGNQNPTADFTNVSADAKENYVDKVIFLNSKVSSNCQMDASILKWVRLVGETGFANDFVTAGESLMFADTTVEFKITNLTNPNVSNEIPYDKFIVTDESMKFMDYTGGEIAALANPTSNDYVMNKVTIGKSSNKNDNIIVSADVYAKTGSKDAEWVFVDAVTLNSTTTVELPDAAVAFKVEYKNTDLDFTAGDILVEVTFKTRESNAAVRQVRKIVNTAVLFWEDTSKNEAGQPAHQTGRVDDVAGVLFPTYDANIPHLKLKNDIVNKPLNGKYYSGGTIDFETVGSVPLVSPADLPHPVMSINLPPYTTLDTTKHSESEGGINGIRATLPDGTVCTFEVTKVMEIDSQTNKPYEKYVLDFGEKFELKKGESIKLEYTANISLDVPDQIIEIRSYGFIGSAVQLPLTAENPTGQSYYQADSDGSTVTSNDPGFDAGLEELENEIDGGKLTYLRRPVHVELTRTDSRLIRKYVSVDGENWLTTEVPVVKPGDNYYYKLTLVNGGDPARRVRMIDILPFQGDTEEFRSVDGGVIMNRATVLPNGAGYEQVQLVNVQPESGSNMKVTVYYYVENDGVTEFVANRDWTADNRDDKTAAAELPMLTTNAPSSEAWAGWTTVAPADMRTVTAVGVEVEYLNGTKLDGGDDYSVVLTMRAPGYTAEHMNEYAEALIANTTSGTVTGYGAADGSPVAVVDRVSSNEVYTKLYITTGAIGDYAFYDNNDNGIQDEGDIPARNIPVTLYRRVSTVGMTEEPQWKEYKTTVTDQTTGKYWFDELPCNYLEPGKTAGSTDPDDYIGSMYFEYYVKFGIPEGYAATILKAGENRAVDSNINEFGVTDAVTLALTVNAEGKLEGEINPTIDAGYVKLVNLGDYVWVDYDKNGVQDEGEPGLNGVTVNLYKLDSAEDTIEGKAPCRTTLTETKDGMDGYYLFELLPKGYYVVEFDLTTVDKHSGYTTHYAFTVSAPNDSGFDGTDSDAAIVRDEADQVRYTETIHLTEDDMTWDAGVTVYSALGGFVFDDQDYNDTQSIPTEVGEETTANGIPLPGTVVTLYKVNEDGSMDPEPIGQQTVGEDGRYFFDELEAGRYKVHFDYPDNYIGVKEGIGDYQHDSENKFFDDSTLNSGFTDIIELPVDTADLTHDAGAYLLSTIGDYVWEDLDRDGNQDEGEAPVKDITVTLQQKLGDGEWTTIETTTTDENGLYLFEGLKSSDHYDVQYRVAFAIPLTVELTTHYTGDNTATDSNALPELDVDYGYFSSEVKPPYGEDDLTIDAGLYYKDGLCEVGDYVWYDDNKDGIQDANEKGVEGIVVILERCESDDIWDEDAWEFVADTKTDENGKYIFKGLEAGRYRIAFGLNEPWIVTVSRVGDIALDSDAIRQSGEYYYTSAFFLNVGDSDMTWDAGIYQPTVIVVPPTTEPTEPERDPFIPPTGDNFNMVIWMAVLLCSMIILVFSLKKVTK